jgi:hypothetical protein
MLDKKCFDNNKLQTINSTRYIYWADAVYMGSIEKARMSGTGRQKIARISIPTALSLDLRKRKLYYVLDDGRQVLIIFCYHLPYI